MFSKYCDGIDRRSFLRAGSLAGLSLAELLRFQHAVAGEGGSKAKSKSDVNCIFLFLVGGIPHQDMFDLKPPRKANVAAC